MTTTIVVGLEIIAAASFDQAMHDGAFFSFHLMGLAFFGDAAGGTRKTVSRRIWSCETTTLLRVGSVGRTVTAALAPASTTA